MSTDNPLAYTNLTYNDIISTLQATLAADPQYSNLAESSVFARLIEIFAATTDLNSFYISSQANESYLDTAKLTSSVILLAKMLGYCPARPEPANTAINIKISGPLPNGLAANDLLYFPKRSSFSFNGLNYILRHTYKYAFTSSDIANGVGNSNFVKNITGALYSSSDNYDLIVSASSVSASDVIDIELMQGEIVSETILGSDTDLIGMKFQKYRINDQSFSNIYGSNDLGYDSDTGVFDQSENLTRIAISTVDVFAEETAGTLPNYDEFYDIDRKTLLRVDSALNNNFTSAVNICLVKSAKDKLVEIEFGDNLFAKLGLTSRDQNIYIQYLSTQGSKANKIGVIGQTVVTNDDFTANSIDLTSNLSFTLKKNITGGGDFESDESIKINAPSNFASFERLVTRRDYTSYLKTLTTPIVIKNAVAWGEQDEIAIDGTSTGTPIKKLFNVVLYSVLAALYDTTSDVNGVRMINGTTDTTSLSSAVLDDTYSPYSLMPSSYFNVLIKESTPDQLNYVSGLSQSSKIVNVTNKLNTRSQITVKNVYITPFIEEMDLVGNIYVKNLANINFVQKSINNSIYSYLNQKADFDEPIYISNINDIISNNPNVIYSDVSFQPHYTSGVTFGYAQSGSDAPTIVDTDIDNWIPVGAESIEAIKNIYIDDIENYINSRTNFSSEDIRAIFDVFEAKNYSLSNLDNFTERNFYNELCKNIYDDLVDLAGGVNGCFAFSDGFTNTLVRLRNSFDYMIKFDMLDTSGNITKFSLRNQIAKISINTTFLYR